MTNSKQSGVVNEIIAYVLSHEGDYLHYCKTTRENISKSSLYNWIFANGQSEYTKNAITRASNILEKDYLFFYPAMSAAFESSTTKEGKLSTNQSAKLTASVKVDLDRDTNDLRKKQNEKYEKVVLRTFEDTPESVTEDRISSSDLARYLVIFLVVFIVLAAIILVL